MISYNNANKEDVEELFSHAYYEDYQSIYLYYTFKPTPRPATGDVNGDVNGDGKVNNKDLGLLMQKLNSWEVEIAGDDGDVNGDGSVNNKDYGLLMQFTNGWDVTLK